jgi:indoleamine 2,3-dioxygenase
VREPLSRLPVISTAELGTEGELRRAHLLLCLFAHAFVWGGTPVMEFLPKGISIPLWEVVSTAQEGEEEEKTLTDY